jgi:hypothetical protein
MSDPSQGLLPFQPDQLTCNKIVRFDIDAARPNLAMGIRMMIPPVALPYRKYSNVLPVE